MKKITKIAASLLAICSLASCASKCDFAKFQEKAKAVEENPYKSAVVKGWYKDDGEKVKINQEVKLTAKETTIGSLTDPGYLFALGVVGTTVATYAIAEMSNVTYYAGSTFKVVVENDDGKATYTWNKYGLMTTEKGQDFSIRVSYKK